MRFIFLVSITTLLMACDDDKAGLETVYIDNGAVQCENSGIAPEGSARLLTDEGIDVLGSQCAYRSDIQFATQCGMGDANINVHSIPAESLSDAKSLGFESVSELGSEGEPGYITIECSESS